MKISVCGGSREKELEQIKEQLLSAMHGMTSQSQWFHRRSDVIHAVMSQTGDVIQDTEEDRTTFPFTLPTN